MKRREFLTKAVPATLAGGLLAACTRSSVAPAVITHPRVQWRMVSSYPRSLDTIFGTAEQFAQRVSDLTEGRFTIRVYPAGELVPGLQVMDAVQQGTVPCGQTASYYYTGKNPVLAFETTVPFGLTTRQQLAWLYEGGGMTHLRAAYADFNILNFPAGSTGAQMGGWFRREINSLADIKGLKMRIPGLGGEVMSQMGATVQVLAGSDVYMALERGAIDATEWVGPYDDEKLGFYKIAKNYYYPGWWEPGPILSNLVNRKAWEALPSAYQQAVDVACRESCIGMTARYDALNPQALNRLLAHGVTLRPFPRDVMEKAEQVAAEGLDQLAASHAGCAALLEGWRAFRKDSQRWFSVGELSYQQFAFRAAGTTGT